MQKRLLSIFAVISLFINTITAQENAIINGIYYAFYEDEAIVMPCDPTYNIDDYYWIPNISDNNLSQYSGDLVIPEKVNYQGKNYTVTEIMAYAFYGCPELTSLVLPNTITEIEGETFYLCPKLTEINIPASVKSIDIPYAFNSMIGLQNYKVDTANSKYSSVDGVLYNKKRTTLLYFPGGRTTLNSFPSEITTIGSGAFSGSKISSIRIPDNVTSIGSEAFSDCVDLTAIILPSNIDIIRDETFYNCISLKSIVIPEGVQIIGEYAFSDCSSLEAIDFPSTLKVQGSPDTYGTHIAFGGHDFGAYNLKTVICRCVTPPTVESSNPVYFDTNTEKTLYVPASSIDLYKYQTVYNNNQGPWSDWYFNKYLPLEDAPDISVNLPDNENNNTGIYSIENCEIKVSGVYDLTGRKLLNISDAEAIKSLGKGIYIVNGKKYVIK